MEMEPSDHIYIVAYCVRTMVFLKLSNITTKGSANAIQNGQ